MTCGRNGFFCPLTRIFVEREGAQQPTDLEDTHQPVEPVCQSYAYRALIAAEHPPCLFDRVFLEDDARDGKLRILVELLHATLHISHEDDQVLEAGGAVRAYLRAEELAPHQ